MEGGPELVDHLLGLLLGLEPLTVGDKEVGHLSAEELDRLRDASSPPAKYFEKLIPEIQLYFFRRGLGLIDEVCGLTRVRFPRHLNVLISLLSSRRKEIEASMIK